MARHQLTPEDRIKGGQNSKRRAFDKQMQEWLEEEISEGTGLTANEAMFKGLLKQAMKGNPAAAKELWDRAFGKSKAIFDGNINTNNEILLIDPKEKDL